MINIFKRNMITLSIVMVLVGAMLFGNSTVYAASGNSTKTSSKSTEKVTADEATLDLLVAASEVVLSKSFGKNYTISRKDSLVTINVWQDGVAMGAAGVEAGLLDKKEWTTMTKSVQKVAESMYSAYEPYGVSVNFNVLNDTNKDNILLSYLNGVKVYDVLDK